MPSREEWHLKIDASTFFETVIRQQKIIPRIVLSEETMPELIYFLRAKRLKKFTFCNASTLKSQRRTRFLKTK